MLLDLSAAFDLVDHAILCERLRDVAGFSEDAVNWVFSFLSGRKVRVFAEECAAEPMMVNVGVPQGACMSPTLFNIYVRPLFDLLVDLGVGFTNYADDTQVLIELTGDYSTDAAKVNSIFLAIQTWMAMNFLALNNGKTELLILGTRQRLAKLPSEYKSFVLADVTIDVQTHVKTLGCIFDSELSFKKHIAAIRSACSYAIRLLWHVRYVLSQENRALVANALVNARLDYGNALLMGSTYVNLRKLQITQNNAVRAVLELGRREHVSAARRTLGWLPVHRRILHKLLMLTFKCRRGLAPTYLSDRLHAMVPSRALRSCGNLKLQQPRFKLQRFGGISFGVLAPKEWNNIPFNLRSCLKLVPFKKALRTFLEVGT